MTGSVDAFEKDFCWQEGFSLAKSYAASQILVYIGYWCPYMVAEASRKQKRQAFATFQDFEYSSKWKMVPEIHNPDGNSNCECASHDAAANPKLLGSGAHILQLRKQMLSLQCDCRYAFGGNLVE